MACFMLQRPALGGKKLNESEAKVMAAIGAISVLELPTHELILQLNILVLMLDKEHIHQQEGVPHRLARARLLKYALTLAAFSSTSLMLRPNLRKDEELVIFKS
jgi:hypothetical protein